MSGFTVPSIRLADESGVRWTSLTKIIFRPEQNWPAQICERPMIIGRVGSRCIALIADPDASKAVLAGSEEQFPKWRSYEQFASRAVGRQSLLASSGERWRRQRRIFGPMFGPEQTNRLVDLFQRSATRALLGWTADKSIDAFLELRRLTLGNIWQAMFGTETDSEPPAAVAAAADDIHAAQLRNDARALTKILTTLAEDAMGRSSNAGSPLSSNRFEARTTAEGLTQQETLDNARMFLAVGHESTALTITWALWLLARDQEAQRQVHHEIDSVIGSGSIEAALLPRLEFTANVLKETLRLFPALPIVARQSTMPVTLAGTLLPAKSVLVICIYALHRHRTWWKEPDQFKPQRFAEGEPLHRFAYLPFSTGRHTCAGNAFGWTEGLTILAAILQRFRLETTQEVRISPRMELLLCPDPQVQITLRDRAETRKS